MKTASAWVIVASCLVTQVARAAPVEDALHVRGGDDRMHGDEFYAACERALNCEIRVDELGNEYTAYKEGMEPYTQWWNTTFPHDLDDDGSDDIHTLSVRSDCQGHDHCSRASMAKRRVEYGSYAPHNLIDVIKERCDPAGCEIGSKTVSVQYWNGNFASAKLKISPHGSYKYGHKLDMLSALGPVIKSHTKVSDHKLCIANPTGGCHWVSLTTFRAARSFHLNRFTSDGSGMKGFMSIGVEMIDRGTETCNAIVTAINTALTGVKGGGYLGWLSAVC